MRRYRWMDRTNHTSGIFADRTVPTTYMLCNTTICTEFRFSKEWLWKYESKDHEKADERSKESFQESSSRGSQEKTSNCLSVNTSSLQHTDSLDFLESIDSLVHQRFDSANINRHYRWNWQLVNFLSQERLKNITLIEHGSLYFQLPFLAFPITIDFHFWFQQTRAICQNSDRSAPTRGPRKAQRPWERQGTQR